MSQANVHVGLAGNPNSGKTSIFNALTGARQHVGNYPGVTVERRTGHYSANGTRYHLLDLPGTYSLTSFSPEERIAEEALLKDDLDVVIVVVDSTALKRSLVLLAQVLQTGAHPVLCLNMADESERSGQRIDVQQLRTLLGIPVVSTVGHRGVGMNELRSAIDEVAVDRKFKNRLVLGSRLEDAIGAIKKKLENSPLNGKSLDYVATKLLVDNKTFTETASNAGERGKIALEEAKRFRKKIEKDTGSDIALFVMERYYGFVDGLLREVIVRKARENARIVSDRIDSVVVNRILGIPIFLGIMYSVFWLTFNLGEYPMGWIESGFETLSESISSLWTANADSPIRSLLVDGIIGGVGGVIVFLPNIVLLFLGLALLEDTGYMSRAAFLVDRLMHRFGLHGKSFIPMMTGFGCSIPGIMATRTMENERDRLTTMLVLPLMSCGARLPIWMLLIPAFFTETWQAPALFGIYMVGIALALVLSLLLRKTVFKGEEAPFVMELPPYRMPTLRAVIMRMAERSWLYLKKAGTVILSISVLMWILTSYPKPDFYKVDQDPSTASSTMEEIAHRRAGEGLEYSIAGRIGQAIEPVLRPLGFDWKVGVALIGAFAAKEVFVSQMGIIYSMGETDEESDGLRAAIRRDYSQLAGVSLMLFLLIASPCMATIAVTRRESGSWKWALLQLGGLTGIAYTVSLIVYQVGNFFV